MYEDALEYYDQDPALPQDPYQQDREEEQRDEQGIEWIRPEDLTIRPDPAAEAALDRGKSVPLPEITWASPDELFKKTPPAHPQHPTGPVRLPRAPTSPRELAADTGVVISRASDAMGGQMARDVMDAVAGDQGARARGRENLGNMVTGFVNEPGRVWDQSGQAGSAMVDAAKHAWQGKGTEVYNDMVEAIYHGVGAIPIFGAQVQAITDEAAAGNYREALGDTLGLVGSIWNPGKTPKHTLASKRFRINMGHNPKALEASKYLTGEGVTPNAAAATDSNFVRGVQSFSKNTPVGAHVGEGLAARTGRELNDLSERLTERAHPGQAFTPETAGQSMDAGLQAREQFHADLKDRHYAAVKRAEVHPSNIENVQVGWEKVEGVNPGDQPTYVPLMKDVGLPVDLRPFREANRAAYETMKAQMGKAFEQYTPAFQAMRNMMEYPEYIVPASFVENELGAIKQIGRETKDGRAKGLAKFMTPQVQAMVDEALSRAIAGDPEHDIQVARKATSTMHDVRDFIKKLKSDQSVDAFHQLVQPRDANIEVLREAHQWAPAEMTKLARAWLDEGFALATNEDGFKGAKGLYARWTKLGDSTKALLFSPALAAELDKFFLGAKKMEENPNPSGTAHVTQMIGTGGATAASLFANPLLGAALLYGQAKFARFFHSPAGVRLLTEGFNVSVGSPRYSTLLKQMQRMIVMDNAEEKKREAMGPPQFAAGGPVRYGYGGDVEEEDDYLREMKRRQLGELFQDPSRLIRQSAPEPKRPAMGPPEATSYSNIPSDTSFSEAVAQTNVQPEWMQKASSAISEPAGMPLVGPPGLAGSWGDSYSTGAGNLVGGLSTLAQAHGPRDVARGVGEIASGAMEAGMPLMARGIKAPVDVINLALKLGAGSLTHESVKGAVEHFGMPEEYANLLGLAAGLGAAHATPSAAETWDATKRTPGAVQDFVNRTLDYGAGGNPERGAVKLWHPGKTKLADIDENYVIPAAGKDLEKEDVMRYFQRRVQERLGAIAPDAPPKVKFQRLLRLGRPELQDQLSQPNPNLDFYLVDTPQSNSDMIQMFPELATDPVKMTLSKAVSAALAQGSNPEAEALNGGRAYAYYRQHGRFPDVQPNDGIPGSTPGAQWSTTGGSKPVIKLQSFLDMFKNSQDPTGEVGLQRILTGYYPVAYLKLFNKNVEGPMHELVPGAMILGPKIGSYFLDISGIPQRGATVDMWDTLAHHRRMGYLFTEGDKPITTPQLKTDRQIFQDFHGTLENEFGLDRTQSQSGLWHYEKELYRRLGVPTPVKGRSDGTKRLMDAWGHTRQNIINRQNAPPLPDRRTWIAPQVP